MQTLRRLTSLGQLMAPLMIVSAVLSPFASPRQANAQLADDQSQLAAIGSQLSYLQSLLQTITTGVSSLFGASSASAQSAAPTFIAEYETAWNSATTPKTTASFSVQTGDVLVAYAMNEDGASSVGISGGSLTWTQQQVVATVGYGFVSIWTATVPSAATFTVSFTGGNFFGGNVLHFRNAAIGASNKANVASGAPSLNLTTTQANSAIVVANVDWSALDGASRAWRTGAGTLTEETYFRDSARYTVYGGYHTNAGTAGAKTVGLTTPSTQKFSIVALEVTGTGGGGGGDTTPPTVSLTAPSNGATVSGTAVTVSANASDNTGVAGVQFLLDGNTLQAEDTTSPYSISWNSTTATNGSHTLTARARDAAGNITTSSGVTVTVNNTSSDTTPPSTPTNLQATAQSSSQINLTWTASTDNTGVTQYRVERCTGASCTTFSQIGTPNTTSFADATGLSPNTTYRYQVRAADAAGNLSGYSSIASATTQASTPPPPSGSGAPVLFFTDLESGPKTGGENGNGAFVTLYGNDFGSSPSVTVGGGAALIKSAPSAHLWYQKMTIQLGPNANTGNIVVTNSNGSSNGLPFTVRSGSIYYVATTGNDSNTGTFTSPWRTVQKCQDSTAAGDICYVGAGIQETQTRAYQTSLIISTGGTAAMPKAIIGYPNANPQPRIGAGAGYAIRVPDVGNTTNYWILANLNVYSNGGNPAFMILKNHDWRVIGNHIECPNFNDIQGCVTVAQNSYTYFYGNELTNVGVNPATQKQSHALYYTTQASHNWTAWNNIHDNYTCRAIQYHSSPVGAGTGLNQVDIHIHDNVINGDNCDGINLATVDAASWPVEIYNNVIANTGLRRPADGPGNFACIANLGWNNAPGYNPDPSGTVNVYNNTLYNCGRSIAPENFPNYGAVGNATSKMNMVLRNNAVYMTNGPYIESQYNVNISGSNNLWYGAGSGPSQTTGNINADPKFVSPGIDFYLQSTSPAIGAGVSISTLLYDIAGVVRGSALDLGAYEYGGTSTPPPSDTTPPTVSLTAPSNGATVSGTAVTVSTNASDNTAVAGVQFLLDGSNLSTEDTTSPYSISWNTSAASNGSHTLAARARDAAGNITTSSSITVTVSNAVDTTPPSTPTNLQATAQSSSQINLTWTASTDNVAVTGYKVERCQGSSCTNFVQVATPTATSHNDTGLTANTTYRYQVRATDAAGNNSSYSTIASATTQAAPPPGSAPTFISEYETAWNSTASPKTTASFSVQAGDTLVAYAMSEDVSATVSVSGGSLTWTQQQVIATTGYGFVSIWTATANTTGSMSVTFTRAGSAYNFGGNVLHFRNAGIGASAKTTNASGAPSLSFTTTQANSAIVVANVDWTALDGTSRTWRTTAGPLTEQSYAFVSGRYTVYGGYHANAGAVGTYTLGLTAPATQKYAIAAVEVTGTGGTTPPPPPPTDTTAPTTSITAPTGGSTVSGTTNITANASDNTGVTQVEFLVDGAVKGTDTTAPYSYSWDTENGGTHPCSGAHTHNLTSRARDAAGNTTTSSAVTVNMNNPSYCGATPPPTPPPPSGQACAAPTLPTTGTRIVNVSTEPQLQTAISNLQNGDTIVLANGTYTLTNTLYVNGKNNVTIRGTSGCDNVTLVGRGMDNASFGNVTFGIWTNSSNTTIAHLTIRDTWENAIHITTGAQSPRVYSVKMIDIGSQFIKSNPTDGPNGIGVDNGIIEYSHMEYTAGTPSNPAHSGGTGYTQALSAHSTDNWIVRNNTIKNLHTPDGSANLWSPAILFWNHSTNPLVENNTFINVDRAVGYGLGDVAGNDNSGGTIRNNFVYYAPGLYSASRKAGSDGSIVVNDSPNTKVYHNTVPTNGNLNFSIEYRFAGSSGGDVRNNLTDAPLNLSRDGASATQGGNLTTATQSMFQSPSTGDLHLLSSATAAINTAPTLAAVTTDFDGQTRPQGSAYDIGADEYASGGSPPPPPPAPLQGDLNNDRTVNALDWSIMNSQWFTNNSQSDINADGIVNSIDFGLMNRNWGQSA